MNLLSIDAMEMDLKATTKDEVIDELISLLVHAGKIKRFRSFKKAILARESQGSTGIGNGIAIPHAKSKAVTSPALAFGLSKNGIHYDSIDGQAVHIFFMIAVPEGAHNMHLETLSKLARLLMHDNFREGLLQAKTKEEVLTLIDKMEEEVSES